MPFFKTISIVCGLSFAFLIAGPTIAQASDCEHGVCFSFPSPNPNLFFAPGPKGFGPFLMDHFQDGDRGYCRNYLGQDFDNCYRDHSGSDFMLIGGFRKMTENVSVIAAAEGEVVAFDDTQYDKCHGSVFDLLKKGDGISCGIDPKTREPRPQINNYVILRHFNGRYYVYSIYYHIKTGSVPAAIKTALGSDRVCSGDEVCPVVSCGDRIAYVGSAGTSFAPHIHFEVRHADGGDTVGYASKRDILNHTVAIDPYFGDFEEDPDRSLEMWSSHPRPASLPAPVCQSPEDPCPDRPEGELCGE